MNEVHEPILMNRKGTVKITGTNWNVLCTCNIDIIFCACSDMAAGYCHPTKVTIWCRRSILFAFKQHFKQCSMHVPLLFSWDTITMNVIAQQKLHSLSKKYTWTLVLGMNPLFALAISSFTIL